MPLQTLLHNLRNVLVQTAEKKHVSKPGYHSNEMSSDNIVYIEVMH
jgi:hypothetical protein